MASRCGARNACHCRKRAFWEVVGKILAIDGDELALHFADGTTFRRYAELRYLPKFRSLDRALADMTCLYSTRAGTWTWHGMAGKYQLYGIGDLEIGGNGVGSEGGSTTPREPCALESLTWLSRLGCVLTASHPEHFQAPTQEETSGDRVKLKATRQNCNHLARKSISYPRMKR